MVNYCPAIPSDQKAIVKIARQSPFTKDAGSPSFTGARAYRNNWVLKAVDGDTIVGFLAFGKRIEVDITTVYFVGVDQAYKRRGIGSGLLEYAEWLLKGSPVRLECYLENVDGLKFYADWNEIDRSEKSVILERRSIVGPRPEFAECVVGGQSARDIFRELLNEVDEPGWFVAPFPSEPSMAEVRERWPNGDRTLGMMPSNYTNEPTKEEREEAFKALDVVGDDAGVICDFNRFTLLNYTSKGWKRDFIQKLFSSNPKWVILTDSAFKYLHLNYKAYGLEGPDREAYIDRLRKELLPFGARIKLWRAHYSATYLLVEMT